MKKRNEPSKQRARGGSPPEEHRFKPGHKGQPWGCKGNPARKKDFLDEKQRVTKNGRWEWITRDETIDHALYKEALVGNVSAAKELERRRQKRLIDKESQVNPDRLNPEEEAALIRAVGRRLRRVGDSEPSQPEQTHLPGDQEESS